MAYRTEIVRLQSGERLPFLFDVDTRMPVGRVVDYSLVRCRYESASAGKHRLDAIGLFHAWADENLVNLDERFATGDLFNSAEMEIVAAVLRQNRSKKISVKGHELPASVLGDTQGSRVDAVSAYIKWRADHVVRSMKVEDPRIPVITHRIEAIVEQLSSLRLSGGGRKRLGLTEQQQIGLFQIVDPRPHNGLNPFNERTRYRNYTLLHTYYELGTRKAEPLMLKGAKHISLHGSAGASIEIIPCPHDPEDFRRDKPEVKTAGRLLPMSASLANAYHTYAIDHRGSVAGAKRQPFFFISSRNAAGKEPAAALSLAAVDDIFVLLRETHPDVLPQDFSSHVMRHTANDNLRLAANARGLNTAEFKLLQNYIMGWSKDSEQSADYMRLTTQREAQALMLEMQKRILGMVS